MTDAVTELADRLRQAEERFLFADASSGGHCDWIVANDDFYVSPRLLELMGLPPGTVFKGRAGFLAAFPHHPDDRDAVVAKMTQFFRGTELRLEIDMRMLVEDEVRWIHLSGLCQREEDGTLIRWTSSSTDITARKAAEEALRASEERFALVAAASTDGIWDWDIFHDAMFLSERAHVTFGLRPGATIRSFSEWVATIAMHPNDVGGLEALAEAFTGDGEPSFGREWQVRHLDGSYHWIRLVAVAVRDATGRPTRLTGSVSNIDSQMRIEAERRQEQRLEDVGRLASGVAHDFNNILAAIIGYGEMALRSARAGSRLRRDLDSIMAAGERGRALVDRILSFSSGTARVRLPVQVEDIVAEVVDLLSGSLPKNIRVETSLPSGAATLMADPTQIHQVLMNLASNAVHAMPDGGVLSFSVEVRHLEQPEALCLGEASAGPHVVISVGDTGTGIDPAIIEKVFDPFFTTRNAGTGTGLGLPLVHGIVYGMGGAILMDSKLGVGSLFHVYLPRHDVTEEDRTPSRPPRSRPALGHGETILVVDDEEALTRLAVETLEWLGYRPVGFTSPVAALEAFEADPSRFAAVVTDERMPDMSGLTLIRRVRELNGTLPILLISGNLSPAALAEADTARVAKTLRKPVRAPDLAESLAAALRGA